MPIAELTALKAKLVFGEVQAFRNLAIVPLVDPTAMPAGWLTLVDALACGVTEITEISESGSVPQLKLINRGDAQVFLLDGEELVGAKQNRILNISILVPGGTGLEIPVSCVEQGRWSWRGRGFSGSERLIFSKLRRSNAESVSLNMATHGSRRGDQHSVWSRISSKSERMSVHSDTGASSALDERYCQDLDEFVSQVSPVSGQVGAAFLVSGRFAGLDILAGPDLLERLLPKLARSYALDAMEDEENEPRDLGAGMQAVQAALAAVAEIDAAPHPAVGCGYDIRLKGKGLVGGALVADGALVHLGIWSITYD